MNGMVWLDGAILDAAAAKVSVFDHGLTVGDGVFETIKLIAGRPFALRRHIERLHRSALGLGLDVPLGEARLRDAIDDLLAAAPAGEVGRLRVTVTGGVAPPGSGRGTSGPTLIMAVAPLEPWEPDTVAITVPWPRNERSAVTGLKTTSYAENVVALAEAQRVGATEAIMANLAGNLCEGTGTNVFVVRHGVLSTPPLLAGCLAGVTRALLLEELPDADEDDLPMSALPEADEVLLTSSTRDVQPLRALDGRELPGAEGPVAKRAIDAIADLQARNLDP
ncbi:MAG TPA: aminotransferase class IV [Acidimicrobiales bacterium]|nr:aminotransferase class IV [Acidimicrobiales bacterium]